MVWQALLLEEEWCVKSKRRTREVKKSIVLISVKVLPRMNENSSDFGKDNNLANRKLARNEERTTTSGPEEVGSFQTEERVHKSSSSPSHQPTNLSLLQWRSPPSY